MDSMATNRERMHLVLEESAVWLSWEAHRRNKAITKQYHIPLRAFDYDKYRLTRYLRCLYATLHLLISRRPNYVFAQVPSIILGFVVAAWKRFSGNHLILDIHNIAIERAIHGNAIQRYIYASVIRTADLLVVTNAQIKQRIIERLNIPEEGISILPDKIPDMNVDKPVNKVPHRSSSPFDLFIVASWAEDEPIAEILAAASLLSDKNVLFRISGDSRSYLKNKKLVIPPNVELTGFLSEDKYIERISTAQIVGVFTTRDDCLVCGAYEALAVEQVTLLSDTYALRDYFSSSVLYTKNSSAAIANSVELIMNSYQDTVAQVKDGRLLIEKKWRDSADLFTDRLMAFSHE
jgi:glycosyltransferase involved in cell wall biosynthesis